MMKLLPEFKTEEEEHEFWAAHDSTEYLDWDQAERVILPKTELLRHSREGGSPALVKGGFPPPRE